MFLVGDLPLDETAQDPFRDARIAAARGIPEIDDEATSLTQVLERLVERGHSGDVPERIVEANVADTRSNLGGVQRRPPAGELIACGQFHSASGASLTDFEKAWCIVPTGQYSSQRPVPRSRNRMGIGAPHPGLNRIANGHSVEPDNDGARTETGSCRVRVVADLGNRRAIFSPFSP